MPTAPRLKWHKLRRRKSDPPFLRENLAAALQAGAACEVDIVFTADGHALCLHDLNLDKETTGKGPVSAVPRAVVERLHQRATGGSVLESPPLFLDEVVDAVRRRGQTTALVQLDLKAPAPDAATLARLGALLDGVAPAFIASGYDWDAVRRLVAAAPGLKAGFDPLDFYPRSLALDPSGFRALATRTYRTAPTAAMYYLEASLILAGLDCGENLVAALSRDGAEIDAWTLDPDTPDIEVSLRRLIAAGCHQITTNDPDALGPMVKEIAACS